MGKRQILLTNDDGIGSPGLWAAAEVLSELGFVTVVAPRHQSSGMGRSLPNTSDGIITEEIVQIKGQTWKVYSVGGSPAQAVLHGILEIMPQAPHLVVSGINYGENVGLGVTISGTIGAALEAASLGYPALAVSLETDARYHLSHSTEVDFSAAAHFTALFARLLLEKKLPFDVDVIKVDVPSDASPQTPWEWARLSRQRYYEPVPPQRNSWSEPAKVGYVERAVLDKDENSDVYVLRKKRHVAVTPLSLDLTSRIDFKDLERWCRE